MVNYNRKIHVEETRKKREINRSIYPRTSYKLQNHRSNCKKQVVKNLSMKD